MNGFIVPIQCTSAATVHDTLLLNTVVYFSGIVFFSSILLLEYSASSGVFADKIYQAYHELNLTQYEAAVFCREHGGQLATIVDSKEQQLVETELISSVDNYWIGLTFDFMHRLTWLDGIEYSGTSLLSLAQWAYLQTFLIGNNLSVKQFGLTEYSRKFGHLITSYRCRCEQYV